MQCNQPATATVNVDLAYDDGYSVLVCEAHLDAAIQRARDEGRQGVIGWAPIRTLDVDGAPWGERCQFQPK